ncbi:MAG: alpha/beta hydrolase [Scytolyngbya sp. HA4215-MV1]|jgi:lysophospholipase L1-like esterase|nr:alpha/beta hydrolase [Scytolyngbya sp. HA4215-MV1]
MQFWKRFKQLFTLAGIVVGCNLSIAPTISAAEEITVRYGLFTQSVAIADLRQYAKTGDVSTALQDFLRYLKREDQIILRNALQVQFPVNLVALDRTLNSALGQRFLAQVAQADDRQDSAGVQALRAALILGTRPGEGLSILSVLEAYPSRRLKINLPKALQVIAESTPHPPQDQLPTLPAWQALVEYQAIVSQGQQYQGCLFGDSISSGLGNSLGENRFNFAIGGMSTVSLVGQLQTLLPRQVHCQTVIIAIGTNDAWYHIEDQQFKQNMTQIITLARSLSAKNIYILPAFYSTVAASHNPELAGPIQRVDEINGLLQEVADEQHLTIAAATIQPLFEQKALLLSLTTDGVHLNAAGQAIYRKALLQLLNANT